MKQTIGNACGTIALLHACCNLPSTLKWANDSFISKFYALTHSLTPDKIGAFLENPPEGGPSMEAIHKVSEIVFTSFTMFPLVFINSRKYFQITTYRKLQSKVQRRHLSPMLTLICILWHLFLSMMDYGN